MKQKSKAGTWWTVGIVVVLVGLFVATKLTPKPVAVTVANPTTLPGMQTGDAPWPPELNGLHARLAAMGLPALTAEGTALHIHQHLDIYIDGKPVQVPANIGINQAQGFISDIHVHDTTGVIHIESPTIQTFTLGQFFDIWGVQFTAQSIGGYTVGGGKTLNVYVNGVLQSGDPRAIALAAHQEIVIAYGTPAELPNPIPSSFTFDPGL